MKRKIHRRGMTLIEVIVAAGAASIIIISILLVYLAATRIASGAMGQLNVQSKARQSLDYILNDVRRSERADIYTSYSGTNSFGSGTNDVAGGYAIFQLPTNGIVAPDQQYHHYYIGNIKSLGNGITNGTLYFFTCAAETNLSTKSADVELVRGVTNPDRVFDWINGVMNLNIRIADENDADGKQIIYLRSSVAFRNQE